MDRDESEIAKVSQPGHQDFLRRYDSKLQLCGKIIPFVGDNTIMYAAPRGVYL